MPFSELNARLQQIATWLLADEAPQAPPTQCTYELWPAGERIRTILFGTEVVYHEHDEIPAYDHADGDQIAAIQEAQEEEHQRRLANHNYIGPQP